MVRFSREVKSSSKLHLARPSPSERVSSDVSLTIRHENLINGANAYSQRPGSRIVNRDGEGGVPSIAWAGWWGLEAQLLPRGAESETLYWLSAELRL